MAPASPFVDPWLQEGKWSPLNWERRLYARTDNPLHVWRAIEICHSERPTPSTGGYPDWVYAYLGKVAERVHALYLKQADGAVENLGADIAELLEFKPAGQGHRTNALVEWDRSRIREGLAREVARRLHENSALTIAQACSNVSEDHEAHHAAYLRAKQAGGAGVPSQHELPVSAEVVEDAYREWRDVFDL